MVTDMTGLPIANASLLDEATAAAEAMVMMLRSSIDKNTLLVADNCNPQTIDVIKTRAEPIGVEINIKPINEFEFSNDIFGILLQYPATDGQVFSFTDICNRAHESGALVSVATDLLSLAILPSPGGIGADIAIGNSQRFGVPIGYGGPHAAFISCSEKFKRKMPGRIIGVSIDQNGNKALRMALQTREQHIRRDRATSNICTAQVLLAVMAGMYAVYHGQEGIKKIADDIYNKTNLLASSLKNKGHKIVHDQFFDTLRICLKNSSFDEIKQKAESLKINFRYYQNQDVGISIDETCSDDDINDILSIFEADGINIISFNPLRNSSAILG